jgi:hypothetical protein
MDSKLAVLWGYKPATLVADAHLRDSETYD